MTSGYATTDGRVLRGDRTRQQVLDLSAELASVGGLEGLSIGALASRLRMSKSGLFAAFGSKEALQCATVDRAAEVFVEQVVLPGLAAPRGLPRLLGLVEAWFRYASNGAFSGGCFFANVGAEFDARPGPVRDQVAARMGEWTDTLATAVRKAREERHLSPRADPAQVAFEIQALMMGGNGRWQLHRDPMAFERARTAIRERLDALSTTQGRRVAAAWIEGR